MLFRSYEARIACNLWAKGHRTARVDRGKKATEGHPYFTQTGKDRESDGDQYIANMRDGATAGFKYFEFDGTETKISVQGRGGGQFLVTDGEMTVATVPMNGTSVISISAGVHPLYFTFEGEGPSDFVSFTIE